MKTIQLLSVLLLSLLIAPVFNYAQDGHWAFKEIIRGNHFGSATAPDKIDVGVNEGVIEFSLEHKNNCTDRYRFTYRFLQDMNALSLPEQGGPKPSYRYEFEIKPLNSNPCYKLEVASYSNPYVSFTHWNSPSGLLGELKKNYSWNYRYHQQFIDEGSVAHYAYKSNVYKNARKGSGQLIVTGPNKKDVDYYLKNYPGIATDFRILFRGQSTKSKADYFYYDILFIYELVKGAPSIAFDPCTIEQPDCSCCPGTIPIWNFKTNNGDCICPEGTTWDKMQNRCVSN